MNEERQMYATFGVTRFHQSQERKRFRHYLPITKMALDVEFYREGKLTAPSAGRQVTDTFLCLVLFQVITNVLLFHVFLN